MPELNAGSMADIAFLLLIFFLVVTTIAEDKGIPVILPEYYEGEPGQMAERNVLTILVNADDDVLVETKPTDVNQIMDIVIDFVTNPRMESDKPLQPDMAVISIQNDVNTSYEMYVNIYSHIHDAYGILRNTMSNEYFQKNYDQLSIGEKNIVLAKYPLKLSEAGPFSNQKIVQL